MFTEGKIAGDVQPLVDYLLGALPEHETEQFDERSITDDEFAWRLNAVENELVDAYVRGELPQATQEQFQATYLLSDERRGKVLFAQALLSRKAAAIAVDANPGSQRRWSLANCGGWQWAAASLLLLAASGFLLFDNWRLRNELARQALVTPAAPGKAQHVEPSTQIDAERQHESPPSGVPHQTLKAATFVLVAQSRDAGSVGTVTIPGGTDRVILRLQLESDDFPVYEAIVRDPATNHLVWRTTGVKSAVRPEGRMVSIGLPRGVLRPQYYTVELAGISATSAYSFAGSYAFRVIE